MEITANNTFATIGESQLTKKLWAGPQLMLIGTNTINSGAAAGIHEKNITNSVPTGGGNYILMSPSGNTLAAHTKNHYYS